MKIKFFSILFLTSICFFSCSKKESAINYIRPVKVVKVHSNTDIQRDFSGIVDAVKYVNLAFRVSGQIINLPVVEGQKVTQGQLIAELDPREIKLTYDASKAAYETAQAQLARNKKLLEKQADRKSVV